MVREQQEGGRDRREREQKDMAVFVTAFKTYNGGATRGRHASSCNWAFDRLKSRLNRATAVTQNAIAAGHGNLFSIGI